jgi:hypothetical protein
MEGEERQIDSRQLLVSGAHPMRTLLVSMVVLLAPGVARAEIAVGQTAEWLAHTSDLIAKATPLEVRVQSTGRIRFTQVRYRLDEVLKGPATAGDLLAVFDYSFGMADPQDLTAASKKKRSLLLFAAVSKNRYREIEGKCVLTGQNPRSAFFLDQPVQDLYTPDFQRLSEIDDLTSRVRAQVAREEEFHRVYPGGTVKREQRESPPDSPAYKVLYSGSKVYVFVPAYPSGK